MRIREDADATTLNPLNMKSSTDGYLSMKLFQSLLSFDFETLEMIPLLAEQRPHIENLSSGKVKIAYTIREKARWDNGQPITADDVAFTLKVLKNPYSSNISAAAFYELIEDISYNPGSKSFEIIFSRKYILNEISSGDFSILPAHVYDTNAYLQDFSLKKLMSNDLNPKDIENLKKFNEEFNSVDFRSNKKFISGSGAYQLEQWISGQRIVLRKKDRWWADDLDSVSAIFQNNADLLVYEIIKDRTTAMVALENGKIDLMTSVSPKDFKRWKNSKSMQQRFNFFSPDEISYNYLGLNTSNTLLQDKEIRKAIQMGMDVEKIISAVLEGYAETINGPVPKFFENHNDTLKPSLYSPEKAIEMLHEQGWKDEDKDGILEKNIDGKKELLSFDYLYYTDNDYRKFIALIIQEDLKKIGIQLHLVPLEWGNFLNRLRNQDFDLFFGSKILAPVPRDHKSSFHSASVSSGSNFAAYSNPALDLLIDSARSEMSKSKRKHLDWRIQEIISEEVPYIYLFSGKERIIVSNQFTNLNISPLRPGYWEPGFQLRKEK